MINSKLGIWIVFNGDVVEMMLVKQLFLVSQLFPEIGEHTLVLSVYFYLFCILLWISEIGLSLIGFDDEIYEKLSY